ncbi:hypothetical protein A2721_00290 [Candidatus Gottesmanbacteria bacterium RIFCSPHIGHO2_01_FULL_47_48]|uniref:Uncharacterized protein n=1 Tax=Candidatus Gottesmanbacteria bacterium RIFCSPHIGHO2_01_FULL_47_48 TaxID=1798381 RepID=A0A1F6A1L8_9BACT|nr:MAG: hypothetical protein A2721_00290 [Candidatus Gottesmanbacteria bacterium RIFCSPHIGHO2_01_FULL_47_48]
MESIYGEKNLLLKTVPTDFEYEAFDATLGISLLLVFLHILLSWIFPKRFDNRKGLIPKTKSPILPPMRTGVQLKKAWACEANQNRVTRLHSIH